VVSLKPAQHLMNKFKKKLLLAPPELPIKYFSIFPVFLEIFSKMSHTSKLVSRMKRVKKKKSQVMLNTDFLVHCFYIVSKFVCMMKLKKYYYKIGYYARIAERWLKKKLSPQ